MVTCLKSEIKWKSQTQIQSLHMHFVKNHNASWLASVLPPDKEWQKNSIYCCLPYRAVLKANKFVFMNLLPKLKTAQGPLTVEQQVQLEPTTVLDLGQANKREPHFRADFPSPGLGYSAMSSFLAKNLLCQLTGLL